MSAAKMRLVPPDIGCTEPLRGSLEMRDTRSGRRMARGRSGRPAAAQTYRGGRGTRRDGASA
jgi:hypothetical protein